MSFLEVLKGLGSLVVLALGVTVFYMLTKGAWLLVLRSAQATARFARDMVQPPAPSRGGCAVFDSVAAPAFFAGV